MKKKQCLPKQLPSPPAPLPNGRGEKCYENVHYRGGLKFSGLLEVSRDLRSKETNAEKYLWKYLKSKKLNGLKFRRQHQIGLYIVDFYCHSLKLIIELDGDYHSTAEQMEKDRIRDKNLIAEGFKILRYKNNTALYNPETIFETIKNLTPLALWERGRGRG